MSENNINPDVSEQKLDAIKQLIFGDNIADYNKRFDELNQVIEDVRSDLEMKLSDLEIKVDNSIATLRQDYERDVNKLEDRLDKEVNKLSDDKLDKKALGKMFQNISEKLQG